MVAPPPVNDAGVREHSRPAVAGRRNRAGEAPAGRRTRVKTQQALGDEQERLRIEGLRILARIIARSGLADATPGHSRSSRRTSEGAANRTRARREADPKGAA